MPSLGGDWLPSTPSRFGRSVRFHFLPTGCIVGLPEDHLVWTETEAETVKACLEPIVQQALNTRDWSGYHDARKFEIKDEMARLIQLAVDYGISDHPDDEEPEDVRRVTEFRRKDNKSRGYPEPGFGYEDSPNQDQELFELRLAYAKQKYM